MIPRETPQTVSYTVDSKPTFDRKSQSILVDTHKIMRNYKERKSFPMRIEGIRISAYA